MSFPDPALTANLYCSGRLDEVIREVVAPSWARFQQGVDAESCYLWMMRYDRRGEHLKLRFHGPATQRPVMRVLLASAADALFATLDPRERDPRHASDAQPIDLEDELPGDPPDGSLLWTRYRRSEVSLGSRSLLRDDGYVALVTTCLARGCDLVLASLGSGGDAAVLHRRRQTVLLEGLLGGLAAAQLSTAWRAAYLRYHRDWLIRFAFGSAREEVLARMDHEASGMEPIVARLASEVTGRWRCDGGYEAESALTPWQDAIRRLLAFLPSLPPLETHEKDPFASDALFPPLFKIFHGLANQLGLGSMDEGFAHHLLDRAVSTLPGRP